MDVRVQEIPMAGVESDRALLEENPSHTEINNDSFSFEDELLELYEALYPNNTCTSTTPACVNHPPPPPYPLQQLITPSAPMIFHDIYNYHDSPPVAVAEQQQEQLQQVAALQRLQAQQEFQLRQQQWLHHQQLQLEHPQLQPQQSQRKAASSTSGNIRKKRKREQMKTVYRVPEENILTVDKWAWRKYGQKPIKGSPFPRNYYRCSSSKGCTGRKQVERSITEPEVYVVTYSGDHFHPCPIHRNALAGVIRADHRTCVYSIPRDDHDRDQSGAAARHLAVSEMPSPQPPPSAPSDEEEGAGLLIPNRMYADEDMLRGIEELGKWKIASGSDSGPASGL